MQAGHVRLVNGRKLFAALLLTLTGHAWAGAPANDNLAARQIITGLPLMVTGTNVSATKEPGEPDPSGLLAGDAGGASVWYAWTAPVTGTVVVRTENSSFDTLLGVFTGVGFPLTTVVQDDDSGPGTTSLVRFAATMGTAYLIAVDGAGGAGGNVTLSISTPPAGDDFANATALSGSTFNILGSSSGANKEAGEPNHGGDPGGASVWFRWMAPSSGAFGLTTAGSNFDTLLGVYTGAAVNALTTVAGDDNLGPGTDSALIFNATLGQTYFFAVDGAGGDLGTFRLALFSQPANDSFAGRTTLSGFQVNTVTDNTGATKEGGEPNHAGNVGGASLWYTWIAPADGTFRLRSDGQNGSDITPLQAVYMGNSLGTLLQVASNAGGSLNFPATLGTTYQIAVDGINGERGKIVLTLDLSPPNDTFANATPVAGAAFNVLNQNCFNGTTELGEPVHAGNGCFASVWYAWTATEDRLIQFSTEGSELDTLLAVYTGNSVDGLTEIASNDDVNTTGNSRVEFMAVAGTTYRAAIDGRNGALGRFILRGRPAQVNITSGITAVPNPAVAIEEVTLSIVADANATFLWNFGDGSLVTTGGPTVKHTWTAAGSFSVSVTATGDSGRTAANALGLQVLSQRFLAVSKMAVKLNFNPAKPNADSLTMSGVMTIPVGSTLAGQNVLVDIGGITRTLGPLSDKGASPKGPDTIKLGFKPLLGAQNSKFSLKLSKANLQASLADEGLTNASQPTRKAVEIPIKFQMIGTQYDNRITLFYTSKLNASGTAK